MRGVLLAALAAMIVLSAGCGGGGGGGTPQPTDVDYTTFTTTLDVGETTGALIVEFLLDGAAAEGVACRLVLPGFGEDIGYRATTGADGFLRVGNIPGGVYDLYVEAPGVTSRVIEVEVYAAAVRAMSVTLAHAPD